MAVFSVLVAVAVVAGRGQEGEEEAAAMVLVAAAAAAAALLVCAAGAAAVVVPPRVMLAAAVVVLGWARGQNMTHGMGERPETVFEFQSLSHN
jgi:hypothetical protein